MIPKVIHYCWFGDKEIPTREKECIESWKIMLPDYKIILWNESNFDVHICKYVEQAYESKKYAFVSDFCRIWALNQYGGIYFDTDVEVLRSFDCLLENNAFMGFENRTMVGTAVIATDQGLSVIDKMLDYYYKTPFLDKNGNENLTTNVTLLNKILEDFGLVHEHSNQKLKDNIQIYDRDVFYPKKMSENEFRVTPESMCIHKMSGTWLSARQRKIGANKFWINVCRPLLRKVQKIITNCLGEEKSKELEMRMRQFMK